MKHIIIYTNVSISEVTILESILVSNSCIEYYFLETPRPPIPKSGVVSTPNTPGLTPMKQNLEPDFSPGGDLNPHLSIDTQSTNHYTAAWQIQSTRNCLFPPNFCCSTITGRKLFWQAMHHHVGNEANHLSSSREWVWEPIAAEESTS